MQSVVGVVQHYAWGDPEFIPRLLGLDVDGQPWAELWLGTHPSGPATLANGIPLVEVTGELPYLMKVLAAAQPLSLQTHPNADQAISGYARGMYPDDQPKPELLVALTPLTALCGVRPVEATLALLDQLGAEALAKAVAARGPGAALAELYRGALDAAPIIETCRTADQPEAEWVRRLDVRYPGEPSVAATLLLNLVHLRPGEAIRLDAGNLHAYLQGAGIELMGASDNVVRGGLTDKDVDVDELLAVLDPTPLDEPLLDPVDGRFELPAAGIALAVLEPDATHTATGHELAIDQDGRTLYLAPGDTLTASATTHIAVPL